MVYMGVKLTIQSSVDIKWAGVNRVHKTNDLVLSFIMLQLILSYINYGGKQEKKVKFFLEGNEI